MHSSHPDFDIMLMDRYQTREEALRLRQENRELLAELNKDEEDGTEDEGRSSE